MGSVTANYGSVTAGDELTTSQEGSAGSNPPVNPVVTPEPSQETWPADTEILFIPGSNKIMLTVQKPVMRAVFQESFERIRAAMLFQNAFPNLFDTIDMITDNIIGAAESIDRATNIYNRLVVDGDYTTEMTRLVCLQLSFIQLLIIFSASRSHPHFPRGGQGSLRCDHPGRILGPSFGLVGC